MVFSLYGNNMWGNYQKSTHKKRGDENARELKIVSEKMDLKWKIDRLIIEWFDSFKADLLCYDENRPTFYHCPHLDILSFTFHYTKLIFIIEEK